MSKLSKFLTGIKKSEETLQILNSHGLDVTKLAGLRSNSTKAKVIKSVLTEILGRLEPETPSKKSNLLVGPICSSCGDEIPRE